MYGLLTLAVAVPFSLSATTSLNVASTVTSNVECMVRCVNADDILPVATTGSCGCNDHIVLASDTQSGVSSSPSDGSAIAGDTDNGSTTTGHPGDSGATTTGHPGDSGSTVTGHPGDSGSTTTGHPGDSTNSGTDESSKTDDATATASHDNTSNNGVVLADSTTQSLPNAGPGNGAAALAILAAVLGAVASRLYILRRVRRQHD